MVPRVSKDVIVVVVRLGLRAFEESSLLRFQLLLLLRCFLDISFHPFPLQPCPPLSSFQVLFLFQS